MRNAEILLCLEKIDPDGQQAAGPSSLPARPVCSSGHVPAVARSYCHVKATVVVVPVTCSSSRAAMGPKGVNSQNEWTNDWGQVTGDEDLPTQLTDAAVS